MLRKQMSSETGINEGNKLKMDKKNRYFTIVPTQQSILTFSCASSTLKKSKTTQNPVNKPVRFSLANLISLKPKTDAFQINLTHSLSKVETKQMIAEFKTPRKDQTCSKQKQDCLRSTEGTQGSFMNEFKAILAENAQRDASYGQIKQNENNAVLTYERSKSFEKTQKSTYPLKSKTSLNDKNKRNSKRIQRLSDYSQLEDFPQEMQQTILEFQEVLDNSSSVKYKRVDTRDEVKQLNEEINNLRLLIIEKDRAWQCKMNDTLKNEKILIVESFKKMLNQLKKMCEWQKFGSSSMASEPIIVSSKKLFSNYPFQHQFKNSMQEIRNSLMQLKIINSQSQTLRQQIQNLRRTLQQERQIKQNIEQQLESLKRINKQLAKDKIRQKQKEQQYRIMINSLRQEVQDLKTRVGNNSTRQLLQDFQLSLKQPSQLQTKLSQLTDQNMILRDIIKGLGDNTLSLENYKNQKMQMGICESKIPITFKKPRKSSLQHQKPYQVALRHQIEALLYC